MFFRYCFGIQACLCETYGDIMRLFIAIQFSEKIKDELLDMQKNMKSMGVKGNYTSYENLHLTLAFIGEYNDADEVLDAMEEIAFDSFNLELEGVGCFRDLFWVGIKKNDELNQLVKALRKSLTDHGIPYDKKKFVPHITLIRRFTYKDGQAIPVRNAPNGYMKVTGISLMKSERGKSGMVYTELGFVSG